MDSNATKALLKISGLNISLQRLQDRVNALKLLPGVDASAVTAMDTLTTNIETAQASAIDALQAQAESE